MILRLALRELWHLRGALVLQIAGLTVAIAAFAASADLSAQTQASTVPGSACGDQVLALSGVDGNGNAKAGWTPRQTRALIVALGDTLGAEVLPSTARAQTRNGQREIGLAFVGPRYFDVLCVQLHDATGGPITTPFTEGAVVDATLSAQLVGDSALKADNAFIRPSATTSDFRGLQFREQPLFAWLPAANAWSRGPDFLSLDLAVFQVLVRPRAGETAAQIQSRLETAMRAQPTLFAGLTSIQAGPSLQVNVWAAEKIQQVTRLLQLFAGGLLLLVLVNLLTYHAGRLPVVQALASTLAALGVPPRALWRYAAIEPIIVGTAAFCLGTIIGAPLGHVALAAVTNEASNLTVTRTTGAWILAFAMTGGLTACIAVIRGRLLARRHAPTRSRAQRQVLKALPVLLTLQIAVAGLTLTLAAQAALGLLKALPPPPNFPLAGLSVVSLRKPENAPLQQNLQLRWETIWRAAAPQDGRYRAALAISVAPFLPNVGAFGTAGCGQQSVQGAFDYVSANFFDVLGKPVPGARGFLSAAAERATAPGAPVAAPMVLSRGMAGALACGPSASGLLVRTNRDPNRPLALSDPVNPVVGEFDDGIVGARGAKGKFSLSQRSMQAAIPLAYVPLDSLHPVTPLFVFVRHPANATDAEIREAVLPAVLSLMPGASIEDVTSAETLFRNPLRKERAMAVVLAVLATASLAIGMLGMIALLSMLLRSLRVELAMRYAVGATRGQVIVHLARRMLPPVAIGLGVAVVFAAPGLFLLAQTLETAGRAGIAGPALGLFTVAGACAGMLATGTRALLRVNFMDWLRYE